ncbi:hypothetical protein DSS3P8_143 [Roseobacter phage DSS3P8]|nr:hypothetical protein DSS3P8_143 [Roseobacter phage DSS3P8]
MNKAVVIQRTDADFAANALMEVNKRLIIRGQDSAAARITRLIAALKADTIHILEGGGQA